MRIIGRGYSCAGNLRVRERKSWPVLLEDIVPQKVVGEMHSERDSNHKSTNRSHHARTVLAQAEPTKKLPMDHAIGLFVPTGRFRYDVTPPVPQRNTFEG
ncbi:hypothetical protein NPIL_192121 [Nephila pilipes]|uniref:Uncharacterized protein n=1 Tax=Nephila pilipes TaxID=299642 RepID=A0A8X6NDM2_NEPPI|nr:hypothetical protein NPIL_192121 [Nephila pilipes]